MLVEISLSALTFGIYKYVFPSKKTKLKNQVIQVFKEKKLINQKGYFPKIISIDIKLYGVIAKVDIKGICSFLEFQKLQDYIKTSFGALDVNLSYENQFIEMELILHEIEDLEYQKIDLNPYQILIGYDLKGEPIIVDMKVNPHLLVTGLQGQGKTYMLKTIIKNLDTKVIMLNAFVEDYKDLDNIIHLQSEKAILNRLESFLNNTYKREKPVYIFFEELATIKNKKIIQTLKELLCIARHYNLFFIGLIQISTKEELQCKSYFNARVSFKQVDAPAYQVALNTTISETLKAREFYLLSDRLVKGKTYFLT